MTPIHDPDSRNLFHRFGIPDYYGESVDDRPPLLLGYPDESGVFVHVWCVRCVRFHVHGRCSSTRCSGRMGGRPHDLTQNHDGSGDRVAHCNCAAPDRYESYYVWQVPVPALAVKSYIREANSTQRGLIAEGRTSPAIDRLRAQQPHILPDGVTV